MASTPVSSTDSDHARLEVLRRYAILDTAAEPEFDAIVQQAVRETGYPTALLSLMDAERCWFKATASLKPAYHGLRELPRDQTICNHAFRSSDLFVVPDTRADARFARLPYVDCPDGYVAYAGAQLITPEGHSIGTLCLLDGVPREPTAAQRCTA